MASSKTFSELYNRLNKEQKKAVDTTEGPVMVVAGPGTGKTEVLTLRIANILQKTDTPPDGILALSFTESGVSAMRTRLLAFVGSSAYRVGIFTFHGFCNSIIQRFPDAFPRIIGGTPVDEIEQLKIITTVLEQLKIAELRPTGDPLYYVRLLKEKIGELKRENISPNLCVGRVEELRSLVDSIPDLFHTKGAHKGKKKGKYITLEKKMVRSEKLCDVYSAYNAELERRHLYDYEDMITEVVSALSKDEGLLRILQEEFLYVLADEHQDANSAQNALLKLLGSYHKSPNIFVVGDPKQAIYRFQGASLFNFESFVKEYPDTTVITLLQNYRSTQNILDAAQSIITKGTLPENMTVPLVGAKVASKKVRSSLDSPLNLHYVSVGSFLDEESELRFVADDIKKKIKHGIVAEEIAILYRYNRDADKIALALNSAGVECGVESTDDVLSDPAIRSVLHILRAVTDFGNDALLVPVLYIDFLSIDPLDIYKFFDSARRRRISLYELLKSKHELEVAGIGNIELFLNLYDKLSYWSALGRNSGALDSMDIIARESGFLVDILTKSNSEELWENYGEVFTKAQSLASLHRNYTLADFILYINALEENGISLSRRVVGKVAGKVRLLTAHRAKGLEFESVYLIGANDKAWGAQSRAEHFVSLLPSADQEEGGFERIEDERRLFFVACTRAKKLLTVTYASRTNDGRDSLPSLFIEEVDRQLVRDIPDEKLSISKGASASAILQAKGWESDYFSGLFWEQGLSVTALNNYIESPWKYFFANLLRVPKAPAKHLAFGTAVHSALERAFTLAKEGVRIQKKEFIDKFEQALYRQPLSEQDTIDLLEKGKRTLTGYFAQYRKDWEVSPKSLSELHTEFSISVTFDIGNGKTIPLRGKLDRLEVRPDGTVRVVDYKTGKPKTRTDIEGKTKSSNGSVWRQLVFYKLLLELYDSGRYKMQEGVIDFIEPDEKKKYRRETFSVTDEDVNELKETIRCVSNEILALSFWSAPCDPEKCDYCELVERVREIR